MVSESMLSTSWQLPKEHYAMMTDWKASLFCGIWLQWDYDKCTAKLSKPGYVEAALHKFQHPWPVCLEDSLYQHNIPQYGTKVQLTDPIDTSSPLSCDSRKLIQQVVGTFLHYMYAVDPTMLTALSDISSQQSHATANTASALTKFLTYCASHPNATIMYQASDMILGVKMHIDSSYLNSLGTQS